MRLATLLLALAPLALHAETAPGNHYENPVFLSPQAIPVAVALPVYPYPGTTASRADFDRLFDKQRTRTPDEEVRARAVVDVKLGTQFGAPYGPLTADEVARWSPFFERVQYDADYFNQEAKKFWKRPRPFQHDPRLLPCAKREWTYAYPSGHATISWVFAQVLSDLDPSRRAAFEARSYQIADDRVLAGVHHPTDLVAGRTLAKRVLAKLRANPRFRREFGELKRGK